MIKENYFRKENMLFVLLVLIGLILSSFYVISVPEGPTVLDSINSSRRTPQTASTISAVGGNITSLNILGNTVTSTWQGYVGNVTGTITLDDSNNNPLYNWSNEFPEGEIYASMSQIDFSYGNIECYNFSKSGGDYKDLLSLETSLGIDSDDPDGINETFISGTNYDSFYAGLNLIDGPCPETQLFNGTGQRLSSQFQEVLLYDNTANEVIYASIIEPVPIMGFDGHYWNFEMVVGENGHLGDTSTTTYYFYMEIE